MRVAVTGATGFIGRRVLRSLVSRAVPAAALVHERPAADETVCRVHGDLRSGAGLSELVRDVDVVLHCASYVGSNEMLQQQVNVDGTARLLVAAERAGIRRVVYLSTAGVYGGLGVGGTEDALHPAPASALSASRLAAERLVASVGGVIVRPNAVVGAGDRWYLTQLVGFILRYNVWPEGGAPEVSAIDTRLLGEVIVSLALTEPKKNLYHAASPQPTSIRELVTPVLDALGVNAPSRSIGGDELRALAAGLGVSRSQLQMVAEDNVFSTRRLWDQLPNLARRVELSAQDISWYAQAVNSQSLASRLG